MQKILPNPKGIKLYNNNNKTKINILRTRFNRLNIFKKRNNIK